jgi:hypothetical protein
MSDLSPLSGEERKLNFGAARSVDDPERTLALIRLSGQVGAICRPTALVAKC